MTTFIVRQQQRHDTAANFTSFNPTLFAGEIGFETDTGKFKIGTGAVVWTSLPYATVPGGVGAIVNADISASAAIVDTKLATISTAGKVSGAAITGGNIITSGTISTTNTFGYSAGAGGTATQSTNKATGVTLNKITGQITTNNAQLNAGAEVTFTVTNSTVAATDVIVVNHASGGTSNTYIVGVAAVAAGSFNIIIANASTTNRSEALVLNFAVIKGVSS